MQLKQNIPNIITLLNLFFGCCALMMVFNFRIDLAVVFVFFALLADFADGFVARWLRVSSPLGEQLDSLADMVSFGVVPGAIMYKILSVSIQNLSMPPFLTALNLSKSTYNLTLPLFGFLITVFSGLRLAIFNVDSGAQTDSFRGLSTPSSCTFILGLWVWVDKDFSYTEYGNYFFGVTLLVAALLVSPIPMISNKFKGAGWRGNEWRYLCLFIGVSLLIWLGKYAFAPAILAYILLSVLKSMRASADCADSSAPAVHRPWAARRRHVLEFIVIIVAVPVTFLAPPSASIPVARPVATPAPVPCAVPAAGSGQRACDGPAR